MTLPPGQRPRDDFPRFGLPPYATRFPERPTDTSIVIDVPGRDSVVIDIAECALTRARRRADLHCVTTWSTLGVEWGGVLFSDFYRRIMTPLIPDGVSIAGAVLAAQDGYRTTLLLEDLLGRDVLIADEMNGALLPIEHGAPLRIVAPAHYGYKNLKHLRAIEFHRDVPTIKRGIRAFLDHPRARVAREERGRWIPGRILRYLYRPLVEDTVRRFEEAMREYERAHADD